MHNKSHAICSYEHGLWCETCKEFFPKGSETYIRYEYILSLFMVVHNIWVNNKDKYAKQLQDELLAFDSINSPFEKVKELIDRSMIYITKNGQTDESASLVLDG